MCFSASASFGVGVVLSAIGVASIKKVQRPEQILFAGIPLIFAAQQITEGFLWLALTNSYFSSVQHITTSAFLFIAQVVWPLWVPFSIILLHEKTKRKFIEKALVIIGAIVSLYLAYCLVAFDVEAKVVGNHISYLQDYPRELSRFGGVLYFMATILPPFFSPIKRMWWLGASIFISYIITIIFYEDYVVSVWCFFASIISIIVFVIMSQVRNTANALVE